MDNQDQDTIIQSSSESQLQEGDEGRASTQKKNERKKTKRLSQEILESEEKKKRRFSADSKSSSTISRHEKRSKPDKKYEKYKTKDYKEEIASDKLSEKHSHLEKKRERSSDKNRDKHYYRDKERDKNKYERKKREEDDYDRKHRDEKYKRRSNFLNSRSSSSDSFHKSHNRKRSSKAKSKSPPVNTDANNNSKQSSSNFEMSLEIKKRLEDMSSNANAPISNSDISKRDRELYVANLPSGLSQSDVVELMNTAMIAISANIKSGNPIVSAWVNPEQDYALLEFRCPEEALNGFKLEGISLLGKAIKLGRPRYQDEVNAKQMSNVLYNKKLEDMFPTLTSFEKDLNNPFMNRALSGGTTSTTLVPANVYKPPVPAPATSKLLVSNLPKVFEEEDVRKLLKSFGKIKSLEMIRDPITGGYSGQCHVEYETEKATQEALHYVMGINLMGNILYIKRSSGLVPTYSLPSQGPASSLGILTNGVNVNLTSSTSQAYMTSDDYVKFRENNPSKVICIKNMITMKELEDDEEYEEFYDDVMEECKNYGKVLQIKIPRPEGDYGVSGIGKVFVEYANRDGATWAKEHLNGITFKGRTVTVVFHPEDNFRKNQLD